MKPLKALYAGASADPTLRHAPAEGGDLYDKKDVLHGLLHRKFRNTHPVINGRKTYDYCRTFLS
ncbi:hypothetical protein HKW97_20810 (plasmid) [Pseudomonas luteola]|uniref:hypothetical protein n=1 Tax=Pseudomonas luteola TaxID=47886 RepID=UPI00388EF280